MSFKVLVDFSLSCCVRWILSKAALSTLIGTIAPIIYSSITFQDPQIILPMQTEPTTTQGKCLFVVSVGVPQHKSYFLPWTSISFVGLNWGINQNSELTWHFAHCKLHCRLKERIRPFFLPSMKRDYLSVLLLVKASQTGTFVEGSLCRWRVNFMSSCWW